MNDETGKAEAVAAEFRRRFGAPAVRVRSPGRINLIGEHTDYNGGLVLPGAVDRSLWFAVGARTDRRLHAVALDAGQEFEADLDGLKHTDQGWPNYLMGVADQLRLAGHAPAGFNCVFGGDVPVGAGLSSSAALECGLLFALNELFALGLDTTTMARLAQRAENLFVGVQCGIMDQYVNLFGRAGHVLKLDCRTLQHDYAPFDFPEMRLAVCDTGVRRRLASSEYNVRRRQCEEGVAVLRLRFPSVSGLRDVSAAMLDECRPHLAPLSYRRCGYVIRENQRVEEACRCLAEGDLASFGALMAASHAGLRDEYEVSCAELDALVDIATPIEGVFGARMMGAGFGGCTVNLLRADCLPRFRQTVSDEYERRCNRRPTIHVVRIGGGTQRL